MASLRIRYDDRRSQQSYYATHDTRGLNAGSRGGGTQDFARQRPGDRTLPAQRLAIEFGDDGARGREAALDPHHEITDQAVIDRELAIREQLDQDGAQH